MDMERQMRVVVSAVDRNVGQVMRGVQSQMQSVAATAASAMKGITAMVQGATAAVVSLATNIVGSLGSAFSALGNAAAGVLNGILSLIGSLVNAVLGLAEKILSSLIGALEQLARVAFKVGGVLAGVFGAAVTAFATAGIKANIFEENLLRTFTAMLRNRDAAQDMVTWLREFAKVRPFTAEDLDMAAEKLLAFRLNVKETLPLVADVAKVFSRSPADIAEIIGRLKSGMMQVRELAEIGLTREDLTQHGLRLDTNDQPMNRSAVLPAVTGALQDRYGGASQAAGGFDAVWTTLKTNFDRFAKLATEGLFSKLKDGIGRLGDVFEGLSKNASVVKALGVVFDLVGVAINKAADALPGFVNWLGKVLTKENVIGFLANVAATVKTVWEQITQIIDKATGGKSLAEMWDVFRESALKAIGMVQDAWNYLVGVIGYFGDHGAELWGTVVAGANRFLEVLNNIWTVFKNLWSTAKSFWDFWNKWAPAAWANRIVGNQIVGHLTGGSGGGGQGDNTSSGSTGGGGQSSGIGNQQTSYPTMHGGWSGFIKGANEAGKANVQQGRAAQSERFSENQRRARRAIEGALGPNGAPPVLTSDPNAPRVFLGQGGTGASQSVTGAPSGDPKELKEAADRREAYFNAMAEQAKVAAESGRDLEMLSPIEKAFEQARRAAQAVSIQLPALRAKQAGLVADAQTVGTDTKEYWNLVQQYWATQGQITQIQQGAIRAQAEAQKAVMQHTVDLADAQASYVEAISKNDPMLRNNPMKAIQERMRNVVPLLIEKYKALKNAIIPGESDVDRLKRLTQAEDTKGEILKAAGADDKPVWTLESLQNVQRAQQQMMRQVRNGVMATIPNGFDPYAGTLSGMGSPNVRHAMDLIKNADRELGTSPGATLPPSAKNSSPPTFNFAPTVNVQMDWKEIERRLQEQVRQFVQQMARQAIPAPSGY